MPNEKLKPCPICGSKALVGQTLDDAWYAMCQEDKCIRIDCYWRTEAEATAAWNRRADGWRPIETAPKDGTSVIINVDDTVGEAYFSASDDHHEGWWWANTSWGDYWADKAGNPTHWLPLPPAPRKPGWRGRVSDLNQRERDIVDGIATIIELALPDEIELFRLIKRSPDKSHAGIARFIAHAIRNRPIAIVDEKEPTHDQD